MSNKSSDTLNVTKLTRCIIVDTMTKNTINPSNLVTICGYAKNEGITRQTVYNWVKCGKLKQVSFLGKSFIDKTSKK